MKPSILPTTTTYVRVREACNSNGTDGPKLILMDAREVEVSLFQRRGDERTNLRLRIETTALRYADDVSPCQKKRREESFYHVDLSPEWKTKRRWRRRRTDDEMEAFWR